MKNGNWRSVSTSKRTSPFLRRRRTPARIARRDVESSQRLGGHCWVIDRAAARLGGFRRLHRRYERKADHFAAFAGIAAATICTRRLSGGDVPSAPVLQLLEQVGIALHPQ
ncbi:hypothetical protein ACWGB8_02650 [Kitasatospora sp. NPDC054939]